MKTSDVIESYVSDVVRRARVKDRQDLALELRELLTEMLADRARAAGRPADDAMVLEMLREFGTPAQVALRYGPPAFVIIPPEQSHSFAAVSVIGVALQWALTLPTLHDATGLTGWWFTWGLGAFWWPGFLSMMALLASLARLYGFVDTRWKPRMFDPERINRNLVGFGLVWYVVGVAFMVALPWIVTQLPPHLASALAFDPEFLRRRAWVVLPLWLGQFATVVAVYRQGRSSPLTRRLEAAFGIAFIALLAWWSSGDIFIKPAADDGAHFGIGLVMVIIAIDLMYKFYRRRTQVRMPHPVG